MKEFIKAQLVNVFSTCTTDKYGSVHPHNLRINAVFGNKVDEVLSYIKNYPIIRVANYSSRVGRFDAVEIIDPEIRAACENALNNNQNYLSNINSW